MRVTNSSPHFCLLACLVVGFLASGCGSAVVSYQAPVIPLGISVDSNGNIQFSASSSWPTPLGTFTVGVVSDPVNKFGVKNTLTIRFNGQDHIYDLRGEDFDIDFQPGYYEQVRLQRFGNNLLLELRRAQSPPADNPPPRQQTCDVDVHNKFLQTWENAGGVSAGCPSGPAYNKDMAYQPFQKGYMLWKAGPQGDAGGTIYVIYNSGKWNAYRDEWVEGMEERGGYTPPSGLIEPKRGFGYVWRTKLNGPDAAIGWATKDEVGGSGLVQDFDGGAVILQFSGQSPVFLR